MNLRKPFSVSPRSLMALSWTFQSFCRKHCKVATIHLASNTRSCLMCVVQCPISRFNSQGLLRQHHLTLINDIVLTFGVFKVELICAVVIGQQKGTFVDIKKLWVQKPTEGLFSSFSFSISLCRASFPLSNVLHFRFSIKMLSCATKREVHRISK